MPEPRKTSSNLDLQKCAGLGITLALALLVCGYAGYRLDRWLDTDPILLIVGCVLGLAAGMTYVIRTVLGMLAGPTSRPARPAPPPKPDEAP